MWRRDVLTFSACAVVFRPLAATAQLAAASARIGYVSTNLAANPHLSAAFRQGLRDLGYFEGRNLAIEWRSAEGQLARFPALIAELVALKVDVIVAANTAAALAAKRASATVPVVFAGPADPVSSGLVASLSRPGGNLTGLSSMAPELVGKCLEFLKTTVPQATRVAVLWHRDFDARTQQRILHEAATAGRELGLPLQFVEARGVESFGRAFSQMSGAGVEALAVLPSVLFASSRRPLVDLAAKQRIPAMYPVRNFADDGGLMSYGPLWADIYRRAAGYVVNILKGAKPADLPVEQPTRFELVINLKTAKALGLTVPPLLLAQADDVIE